MEMLDGTIIATALPQMAHSFHSSAVSLNIGMTAYLLTLAVFIPISGWVADRFGSRSIFAAAIGTFTLASVFCGLSHTLTQFTLMRILQGIGGAMMVPVGRLIVLRATPKEKLTEAIAYITWPGLTALVVGPPLGGFITTYASWHWIFFLNLPIGIIALILTLLWVENARIGREARIRLAHLPPRGLRLRGRCLWDGKAGKRRCVLASARTGAGAQHPQWGGCDCRGAPQSGDIAHRSGIDEAQDLFAVRLRGERFPYRRLGAAVFATSHVSNCVRAECVPIRSVPAGDVRRRSDDEGICHPGASPLRFPPAADRQRHHHCRVHGSVRAAQSSHAGPSDPVDPLLSRSVAIDAVHLHDDAGVHRDSARAE